MDERVLDRTQLPGHRLGHDVLRVSVLNGVYNGASAENFLVSVFLATLSEL